MTKTARQVLQMGGKARKRPTALIVEVEGAATLVEKTGLERLY